MQQVLIMQLLYSLYRVWYSLQSLSESGLVFLFLTIRFFGGMIANNDLIVYIFAREHLFHHCKIGQWRPYDM